MINSFLYWTRGTVNLPESIIYLFAAFNNLVYLLESNLGSPWKSKLISLVPNSFNIFSSTDLSSFKRVAYHYNGGSAGNSENCDYIYVHLNDFDPTTTLWISANQQNTNIKSKITNIKSYKRLWSNNVK